MIPRIVIDTNILVSGLLNASGRPARVLDLAVNAEVTLLVDERILEEFATVLARPKFRSAIEPSAVDALLAVLSRLGERVAPRALDLCLADAGDAPFLEVAVSGNADALVTGNQRDYPPITGLRVLGPGEFLASYAELSRA